MEKQSIDVTRMTRYCVVCEREFGSALEKHCTDTSLVATMTEGVFKKKTRYFTLEGVEINEDELSSLKKAESAKAAALKQQREEGSIPAKQGKKESVLGAGPDPLSPPPVREKIANVPVKPVNNPSEDEALTPEEMETNRIKKEKQKLHRQKVFKEQGRCEICGKKLGIIARSKGEVRCPTHKETSN